MTQESTSDLVLHDIMSIEEPGQDDTAAPVAEAEAPAASEAPAEEEVRRPVYELDPNDLYGSFKNLFENDPYFRNVAKSFLGRERRSELQRRIAELEAQLANERYERYRSIVSSVPEEQIEEAAASDPLIREAKEYVESFDPSSTDEIGIDLAVAISDAFEDAEDWIPAERLAQYRALMQPGGCQCSALDYEHGVFDHDPQGRPLSALRSFQYFKSTLDAEVSFARNALASARGMQQAVPAQQQNWEQPPVTAQQPVRVNRATVAQSVAQLRNPKLNANPDLSSAQVSQDHVPLTKDDVDRMSVEEIIRRWPNDGDFERDVLAGKVLIPGINA